MAKRAPKSPKHPKVDAFDIERRTGEGIGLGRFLAKLTKTSALVDVLILKQGGQVAGDDEWIQCLQNVEHRSLPKVVAVDDTPSLEWVAFEEPGGRSLTEYLESEDDGLAEIETLHVIMQLATALQTAHLGGLLHGRISANVIRLLPSDGQLYEVFLTGWLPPRAVTDTSSLTASNDLKALGRLFYQMITGVLPPSAQADDTDELEGQTAGAFDDVLLDWIEEDRDLKGLGGPALEAMADTSSFNDVSEFLEALLPHFREHLKSTIDSTGKALDEDRAFMGEVERQRNRLRELENRQKYLRDWLDERREHIDDCDRALELHVARLRSLEALQTEVALMLGQTSSGTAHAIDDVLSTWANDAPINGLFEPEGFSVEGTPKVNDGAAAAQSIPPFSDADGESGDIHLIIDEDVEDQQLDPRVSLRSALLTLLAAVVIGAVAAGLVLYQPTVETAQTTLEAPRIAATESQSLHNAPSSSAVGATAVKPPPSLGKPTPSGTLTTPAAPQKIKASAIGSTPDNANEKNIGATEDTDADIGTRPDADASSIQTRPRQLTTPPTGMVAIQPGTLKTGLTYTQAALLKSRCATTLKASPRLCKVSENEMKTDKIQMNGFYLDRYEVSQGEYDLCVKAKKCKPIRTRWTMQTQPATGITHAMASSYCKYKERRLPTVNEWLYAARGHLDERIYPWGDEPPKTGEKIRANFGRPDTRRPAPDRADTHYYAAPVKTFSKVQSPWGAANLAGNVREWTFDRAGQFAQVVGGGWRDKPTNLRVTRTQAVKTNVAVNDLGFRCATDANVEEK